MSAIPTPASTTREFDPQWLASLPALSVNQPWATSIVLFGKPVENRNWPDSYREREFDKLKATDGWFRVHASKASPLEAIDSWRDTVEQIPDEVRRTWPTMKVGELPLGGIIGVAHCAGWVTKHDSPWYFGPGALVIDEVYPLPFSPCRGNLGFFMPPIPDPTIPRQAFLERELEAAYQFAGGGGQALHIISGRYAYLRKDTPSCFKGRGEIAHLFDQNEERLKRTARELGVRVLKVERTGQRGQHIDLCGGPLERARALFSVKAPVPLSTDKKVPAASPQIELTLA